MGLFPTTIPALIESLASGENSSDWKLFVSSYGRGIQTACAAAGLAPSTAEDLAQDVLMKLIAGVRSYSKDKGKFRPWLNTVIANVIRDYHRSAAVQREGRVVESGASAWADSLAESVSTAFFSDERLLLYTAIERARSEAPSREWEVFRRRHIDARGLVCDEGQSIAEVAAALGITQVNVKVSDMRFRVTVHAP